MHNETVNAIPEAVQTVPKKLSATNAKQMSVYDQKVIKGFKEIWVRYKVRLHVFFIALHTYRSFAKARKAVQGFAQMKKEIYGHKNLKAVQVDRKYFFSTYAPGFPSAIFDNYIKNELAHFVPIQKKVPALSFIFFAITRKCPLQCEHCFEWHNLNGRETFTVEELQQVVRKFQGEGVSQFHLSGGEPLVRIIDLETLIATADKKSEFWVLTSGFHLTRENAIRLKKAGATGIVISLDHFDATAHNAFRGFKDAYQWALQAVQNAKEQKLVVALTVCVAQSFATWENLMQYATLAKSLGVAFVQLLEPKAVGHYKDKDVMLGQQQLQLLEKFYTTLNASPQYKDFPVILYHGYHQRRIGCLSAGNRNLYIDAAGYVNACPFCQTKTYHIKDALAAANNLQMHDAMHCPRY